ncbi:MAG: MerR family transcriptional regulator [Myxococcales bacterium]|nr:MerR family transcriptional regulator [Myxococcales bacterium]
MSPEEEPHYSVGAVTRLTGLSAHVLRAWERRYGAVEPLRTAGGTRRYREEDVQRLRLMRAAVDGGHSIREIAQLPEAQLRKLSDETKDGFQPDLEPLLDAIARLDTEELDRALGLQLAALGARDFFELVAVPLLQAVGDRWAKGTLCVASEHLASVLVRNLLGSALRRRIGPGPAPRIIFTTPPGERHELGILASAVAAVEAGAHCTYLGPDLPVLEIARSAEIVDAHAVAVGVSRLPAVEAERALRELREAMPDTVEIWLGGPGSEALQLPDGISPIEIDDLEHRIGLLAERVLDS